MRIPFTLPLLLVAAVRLATALPVSPETATLAAENWFRLSAAGAGQQESDRLHLHSRFPAGQETALYLFTSDPVGFLLVAGSDAAPPIIGYSTTDPVTDFENCPAVAGYLNYLQTQIRQLEESSFRRSAAHPLWQALLQGESPFPGTEREIEPLLSSRWHQGCYWNELCPPDVEGPCEHAWAGCLATAMGQIMRYWEHPLSGEGANRYLHPDYGVLEVEFGAAIYDWGEMPSQEATGATALLLYHCGVAVNMNYGPDGSGAQIDETGHSALYAYPDHFRYDESIEYVEKVDFEEELWNLTMSQQLDAGQPVLYVGYHGYSGHAFVLDGYQNDYYFHINWGWGGSFNGYFYLNDLTPGSAEYNENQCALINLFPAPVIEPLPVNDLSINVDGADVVLTWSAVDGATEYKVFRLSSPYAVPTEPLQVTAATSCLLVNELLQTQRLFYVVTAVYQGM